MMTAPDVAADAFQAELDEILRGLVRSVNEEAAATVAEALDPTRESHRDLKAAADSARSTVKEAGDLVTALKDTTEQLASALSKTESLNKQLKSAIDGLEKKQIEHEKAMQTRMSEIDESVRGRGTAIIITIIACSLVVLGTIIGVS